MSKIYLVTFANGNLYEESQKNLNNTLSIAEIDEHIIWNLNKLKNTNFYIENKKLLDIELGNGYWAWKPYIILEKLNKINNEDILIYMDASRYEMDGFKNSCKNVINFMNNNNIDIIPGFENNNKNDTMIKNTCLKFFNLEKDNNFLNKINIFTSPMFLKKTNFTLKFIKEWLDNCLIENIISYEDLSYKNGKIHIYDQAILNCLLYKYKINSYNPLIKDENEFRKFTYYFNYFK